MTTVGFATLDVIPSLSKVNPATLERQAATSFAAAGKVSGAKFGEAAGTSAATGLSRAKGKLLHAAKEVAAPLAGVFAAAEIVNFLGDSVQAAREAQAVERITAQVISSTGKAANLTAEQVKDLSARMQDYAAVNHDAIQAGENVLLTFQNVKDEVGAGNDIFDRATKAGLDLSAVFGGDLAGSARLLGKALNDPVKNMSALSRKGVQFTADQTANIKALVAQNRLLDAQKIILGAVEGRVGGAAGAAADDTKRLGAEMHDLEESIGGALLPVVQGFSRFMVGEGIPAIENTGGAVKDLVGFFGQLPGPVKAAVGALAALKIASAVGITSSLSSGAARAGSALDTVRLKATLAATEYRSLRAASIQAEQQGFRFSQGQGRIVSSLGAVKSAAAGAGGALKSSLGGAYRLVGGGWGLAFIAGTAILTHFWQESEKTKAQVKELTDSLNQQTGAVTKLTKADVFKNLQDSGAIDAAKALGVNLKDLTDAALGSESAQARVNATLTASLKPYKDALEATGQANSQGIAAQTQADKVTAAIGGQNSAVNKSVQAWKDQATALGTSVTVTGGAKVAMQDYGQEIKNAEKDLRGLIRAEEKRHDNAVSARRDEIALRQAVRDATKESKVANHTLDDGTKAGDKMQTSLLDLADQWNNSKTKVQNAKGAYKDIRQTFIDLADQMNGPKGTRKAAIQLANSLLDVPKNIPIQFRSTGYKERMAEIAALKLAAKGITSTIDFNPLRPDHPTIPSSGGGKGSSVGDRTVSVFQGANITVKTNDLRDLDRQLVARGRAVATGALG